MPTRAMQTPTSMLLPVGHLQRSMTKTAKSWWLSLMPTATVSCPCWTFIVSLVVTAPRRWKAVLFLILALVNPVAVPEEVCGACLHGLYMYVFLK